jgi:hypothetical protein
MLLPFGEQQRRNKKPTEDKEGFDTQEATPHTQASVVEHHRNDGDGAQSIEAR